jgi:hypothetical protein
MSFSQTAYDASLAYGKYTGYRNIIISVIIGIIFIIISLCMFFSNPSVPVTNTPTNTPTTDNTNTPSTQNTPPPAPAPLWLKSLFLVIGLLLFVGAYMYYKFISSKSNESVVATHGAVEGVTDVSRGIRNIFVSEGGYYYIK